MGIWVDNPEVPWLLVGEEGSAVRDDCVKVQQWLRPAPILDALLATHQLKVVIIVRTAQPA